MPYKKKLAIVQAFQLTADNLEQLEAWCKGSIKGIKLPRHQRVIDIQNCDGEIRAEMYDWIVQGGNGQFEVLKPAAFYMTYDHVDDYGNIIEEEDLDDEYVCHCFDDESDEYGV